MRQLHVLGLSADGRQLLLATDPEAARPAYTVAMDARLDRIVRTEPVRDADEPPLAVKDIQAALRAGASPEEVAARAGVAVARIERYAGPVISERARILDEALNSFALRSRLGRSTLALGDAVARSLGARPEDEDWTVVRGADGVWVLRLALRGAHGRRGKVAAWSYQPTGRELVPLDTTAATLGHLERGRPAAAPSRSRTPGAGGGAKAAGKASAAPKKATKAAAKSTKSAAKASKATQATKATKAAAKSAAKTSAKPAPSASRRVVPGSRVTPRPTAARATPARPPRPR